MNIIQKTCKYIYTERERGKGREIRRKGKGKERKNQEERMIDSRTRPVSS